MGVTYPSITYYLLPSSSKINEIEFAVGNLIFCEDMHRIYLDGLYKRVCYDCIVVFDTEAERIEYASPSEGFYFVEESKTLWRYKSGWTSIAAPEDSNLVFIPKSELPVEGKVNVLYVCGTEQYIWSPTENKYLACNSEAIWNDV